IDRSSRRMRVGEAAVVDRKRRLRRKVGGAHLIGDRLGAYVVGLGLVGGGVQQACGKRDRGRAEHEPTYPCRTQSSQHSATPYAPRISRADPSGRHGLSGTLWFYHGVFDSPTSVCYLWEKVKLHRLLLTSFPVAALLREHPCKAHLPRNLALFFSTNILSLRPSAVPARPPSRRCANYGNPPICRPPNSPTRSPGILSCNASACLNCWRAKPRSRAFPGASCGNPWCSRSGPPPAPSSWRWPIRWIPRRFAPPRSCSAKRQNS